MKQLFTILACILTNITITTSELPHPPIEPYHQHGHFNDPINAQFVIGCDITISEVRVGLFEVANKKPKLVLEYRAPTNAIKEIYTYLEKVFADIKNQNIKNILGICFAVPGGVQKEQNLFLHPHLPWNTSDNSQDVNDKSKRGIKKDAIQKSAKIDKVYFVNDFQAAAIGIQALPDSEIITLQAGTPKAEKTKLVLGAGNGLGSSLLQWDATLKKHVPFPLNYSFTEYAAQTDIELAYFNFLKKDTGNIAWGKVLGSAGGIAVMYKFLNQHHRSRYKNDDPFTEYQNSDYLTIFAKRTESQRCQDAVDLYMNQYIRFIRNAAYAQAAHAGVYITNAVVQHNPELFNTSSGFIDKVIKLDGTVTDPGSKTYLENYLKEIPFYVVTNKDIQLYGAAMLCIEPNLVTS